MTPDPALPPGREPHTVRVAAVQYGQRRVASFAEFVDQAESSVLAAAGYGADFVLFPEFFPLQLLSTAPAMIPTGADVDELTRLTPAFREAMAGLARRHRVNLVAGSHPVRMPDGRAENLCHVFLRDGAMHVRAKIHPTPSEAAAWNLRGGDAVDVIATDCGPVGVLICYDSEFPELGALPGRRRTWRSSSCPTAPTTAPATCGCAYCCARARHREPDVRGDGGQRRQPAPRAAQMDIHYGRRPSSPRATSSSRATASHAEAEPCSPMLVLADLRMDALQRARDNGTVRNLRDRRTDLYRVEWKGGACGS
jgi:predicted amidohydrolase